LIQKISFNLGIATLTRLIVGGIGLVTVSLLTRNLGPSVFGQYSAIFAYLFVFTSLADLGLYTILTREISKPGADEDKIVSSIFTLRLVFTFIFLLLANAIVLLIPYPAEVKIGILVCSILSFFSSLAQVLTGIFQKHLQLYLISLSDIISRVVQLAVLLFLAHIRAGLIPFVWAAVISEIIHFVLVFNFSRKTTKIYLDFDFGYWKKVLPMALPIAISLVFVLIYFKLDTVLLSIMKPNYDVGVYSLAYKMLEALIFLPSIYIGLVMPLLSKSAFLDVGEFKKVFQKAFDVLSIFALPLLAYLFVMSDKIVGFIGGASFSQAGDVLKILSIAIAFIFFSNLSGNAVIALDLQKKSIWVYFLGAVVNLVGNIILIPKFSYFATAWTTVATEALITFLTFRIIRGKTNSDTNFIVFVKSGLAALIMAALIFPFRQNLILGSVIAISYFLILYLFKGFTKEDIREIASFKKQDPPIGGLPERVMNEIE
jgi:O-antigen/teichoic acid export membrane protein